MYSLRRIEGWYDGRPVASGSTPPNPSSVRSRAVDENVDDANWIVLADPVFHAFRKQRALPTIRTINKALHPSPPQIARESYRANHIKRSVFTQPGSKTEISCRAISDFRSSLNSRQSPTRRSRPKSANGRHRACTPLDNFLGEDLAFTRKGQSENDFSCWRAPRPPRDAMLAHVADEQLYEQLRIRFYIHQNFPGDDFGVSKIKVMQACLNKLQHLYRSPHWRFRGPQISSQRHRRLRPHPVHNKI